MTSAATGALSTSDFLRIALVGDLHTYALAIWPWELLGKPLAGQLNLWLNRRRKFDRSLIAPTVARAITCRPELALLSGDLTTTSRPREFQSIAEALQPLVSACETFVVAGNHDRYTFAAQRSRRLEQAFRGSAPEILPYTRPLIGNWRLMAIDSAVPRLLDSRGCISQRQLQHARSLFQSMGEDEGIVVLCHYPFGKPSQLAPMKPGHRLLNEEQWRQTIAECRGRVVIMHGHVHCPWIWRPRMAPVSEGLSPPRVLDINAGSPTMVGGGWPRGQGFWIVDLPADPVKALTLTHHVMGGEGPVGAGDESPTVVESPPSDEWRARSYEVRI